MSTLRVDNITNEAGSASPNLPNGLSGDVLTSGTVDTARMPAGSVIQVVKNTTNTRVNITSSSYQDTGLSASITPTSANSKILVLTTQLARSTSAGNFRNIYLRIARNGTEVFQQFSGADTNRYWVAQVGTNYLDSPATTSTVTYKTQGYSEYSGSVVLVTFQYAVGSNLSSSSITLMEIAG